MACAPLDFAPLRSSFVSFMVQQLGNIRAAAYEFKVEHLFQPRARDSGICLSCYHKGDVDRIRSPVTAGTNDRQDRREIDVRQVRYEGVLPITG